MESIKDRSTLNWTTDDRRRPATGRRGVTLMALFLAVGLISVSAFAQTNGTMQVRQAQLPRGAVFLNDTQGGHWWVGDQAQGLCKVTPAGGATQPPFILTSCNAVAKSAGQIAVGDPAPALAAAQKFAAGTKFIYVPDYSTTKTVVVRFVFNPAGGGSIGANTPINVPNVTAAGGGAGGGRSVSAVVTPHNGPAANGGLSDLYVGYIKSGDIVRVDGVDNVAMNNSNPPSSRVGSTTDGRGVNSLLFFGSDLYIGEIGGNGVSVINDPSGVARTACSSLAVCTGSSLGTVPSAFPGGMATDWLPGTTTVGKAIFVGDCPFVTVSAVLRYDPATGVSALYSQNVSPSYAAADTNGIVRTWTTYSFPIAIGYNSTSGELFVGDDPQAFAAAPALAQGHFWKVARPSAVRIPSVTSIAPISGTTLGGTRITVTGSNLATYDGVTGQVTALPTIGFGANAGTGVACANAAAPPPNPTPGTCTVTSPAGSGTVDVQVTIAGQTSAIVAGDKYTYVAPLNTVITVTSVVPVSGVTSGGTLVTIGGSNLAKYNAATGAVTTLPTIKFGANAATGIACQPTAAPVVLPVASICTAISPAGLAGIVDVQATNTGLTSAINAADKFTYIDPTPALYAWGLMAPKGGAAFIPGALGGHWWTSDEGEGFCRQDLDSSAGAFTIAGNTLHAANLSVCAPDIIGGAGQSAYDANVIPGTGTKHYIYIGDNQIFGTLIWRLTIDSSTETLVADPATGDLATSMIPLTANRVLRPNGMALGPDGSLYVSSLTHPEIQRITGPSGDPRLQTLTDVALTGDGRGANGSNGFIGNILYVSGNRATQFFDITKCPLAGGGPCGMASVPAPALVFVAGTATDPAHKFVYLSNSAGGSPASILRYDASKDVYVPFAPGFYPADVNGVVTCTACTTGPDATNYVGKGGLLPAPNSPNGNVTLALTGTRPWDQTNHPTAGIPAGSFVPATFAFAFGIECDPAGNLAITEDPSAGARAGRGTFWIVPFVP